MATALDYLGIAPTQNMSMANKASNLKPKKKEEPISSGMSIDTSRLPAKTGSYLDVLEQRKQELQNKLDTTTQKEPLPVLNFGQGVSQKGVTSFEDYKQTLPQEQGGFDLIPKAYAEGITQQDRDNQIITETYDDVNIPEETKQEISKMIGNGEDTKDILNFINAVYSSDVVMGKYSKIKEETPTLELTFGQKAKEFGAGVIRAGEQIPRVAGNIGGLVQSGLGEVAGYAGEVIGVPKESNIFYKGGKALASSTKALGEEITRAGEGNITEEQRGIRRTAGELALTAPVPIKGAGLVKGTGLLPTIGRGAIAGLEGTATYVPASEGRLPTGGELTTGAIGGAIVGPVLEKGVIPIIGKGITTYQKAVNPTKFTQEIDNETTKKIRQAFRPSISGVDTSGKYAKQDTELLQGVKQVVAEGHKPTNAKEAMEAITKTKQNLWNRVEEANKRVMKTTNSDELADDIYKFIGDEDNNALFRANPELENTLVKYAEEIRGNKRFENLTQDDLQELLTDTNAKIPSSTFLKQLDSNPIQTQKNAVLSSILRDKIDTNLMDTLGNTSQDLRNAYGAVRQLEKNLAKRYGVYVRQNPKGLADMFGLDAVPDIVMGAIKGDIGGVAKGIAKKVLVGKLKQENNPNTIIKEIFDMQSKIKGTKTTIPGMLLKSKSNENVGNNSGNIIDNNSIISETNKGQTKLSFKQLTGQDLPRKLKPNQPKNEIPNPNIQETPKTGGKLLKKLLPSNFKEKAQDFVEGVAEKTGAKINLMPSGNNKINYKDVEKYYKQKTGLDDVSEIMDRFKKSSIENQQNVMKKINTPKVIEPAKTKENILENLNPTGGLYVNYTPEIRATAKLGPNITTLDKTMKVSPDTEIVIYRGAPKSQKSINAGDFVTTNYDLAKSYTGEGNILKMKVKAKDVLDDITEPLGEEYIYRPKTNLLPTNSKQVSKVSNDLKTIKQPKFKRYIPEGITEKDADIIAKYTGWGYKDRSFDKDIDRIIKNLPNEDGFFARKDNLDINLFKKGELFSFKKPVSATKNFDNTSNFKGNIEFVIEGNTAKDISKLSNLPEEQEVLFSSNTKFKVTSINKSKDGTYVVGLKEY